MQRRLLSSLYLLVSLSLAACGPTIVYGSGHLVTEPRTVSNFDAVTLSGSGELTITQGENEALTIEAEDNILPYIRSEVHDGALFLSLEHKEWFQLLQPTQPIKFKLTVKQLAHLDLSGSGTTAAANVTSDQLTTMISGSGNITINPLTANKLTVTMNGSGRATLAGKVAEQTVDLSGDGHYQADDLESRTAKVTISGSGDMTLWVHERLDANISGSGAIRYYGAPQTNTQSSGSGSFKSLGNK